MADADLMAIKTAEKLLKVSTLFIHIHVSIIIIIIVCTGAEPHHTR